MSKYFRGVGGKYVDTTEQLRDSLKQGQVLLGDIAKNRLAEDKQAKEDARWKKQLGFKEREEQRLLDKLNEEKKAEEVYANKDAYANIVPEEMGRTIQARYASGLEKAAKDQGITIPALEAKIASAVPQNGERLTTEELKGIIGFDPTAEYQAKDYELGEVMAGTTGQVYNTDEAVRGLGDQLRKAGAKPKTISEYQGYLREEYPAATVNENTEELQKKITDMQLSSAKKRMTAATDRAKASYQKIKNNNKSGFNLNNYTLDDKKNRLGSVELSTKLLDDAKTVGMGVDEFIGMDVKDVIGNTDVQKFIYGDGTTKNPGYGKAGYNALISELIIEKTDTLLGGDVPFKQDPSDAVLRAKKNLKLDIKSGGDKYKSGSGSISSSYGTVIKDIDKYEQDFIEQMQDKYNAQGSNVVTGESVAKSYFKELGLDAASIDAGRSAAKRKEDKYYGELEEILENNSPKENIISSKNQNILDKINNDSAFKSDPASFAQESTYNGNMGDRLTGLTKQEKYETKDTGVSQQKKQHDVSIASLSKIAVTPGEANKNLDTAKKSFNGLSDSEKLEEQQKIISDRANRSRFNVSVPPLQIKYEDYVLKDHKDLKEKIQKRLHDEYRESLPELETEQEEFDRLLVEVPRKQEAFADRLTKIAKHPQMADREDYWTMQGQNYDNIGARLDELKNQGVRRGTLKDDPAVTHYEIPEITDMLKQEQKAKLDAQTQRFADDMTEGALYAAEAGILGKIAQPLFRGKNTTHIDPVWYAPRPAPKGNVHAQFGGLISSPQKKLPYSGPRPQTQSVIIPEAPKRGVAEEINNIAAIAARKGKKAYKAAEAALFEDVSRLFGRSKNPIKTKEDFLEKLAESQLKSKVSPYWKARYDKMLELIKKYPELDY